MDWMKKVVIILPTYNERENIREMIEVLENNICYYSDIKFNQ